MKKKIIKISLITILVFIILLLVSPLIFKDKIVSIVKSSVNDNIDAKFDFKDASLSFLSGFPNPRITLEDITVINQAPFDGDTLFASKKISIKIGLNIIFGGIHNIPIKSIVIREAQLNIKTNKNGIVNYDIAKDNNQDSASSDSKGDSSNFSLDLQSYKILNSHFVYNDRSSDIFFKLYDINHSGKGDLSLDKIKIKTSTEAFFNIKNEDLNIVNKLSLDALIGIDLNESKYSFIENKAFINQLPLIFDGYIKLNENNQQYNITFQTPSSDFKNFIGLIPEPYSKNLDEVETQGKFKFNGFFKGILDEKRIPAFSVTMSSEHASIKHPKLGKAIDDIHFDLTVENSTGLTKDISFDLRKFFFRVDEDKFSASAHLNDLIGNTQVEGKLKGKINLDNLSKAYPIPEEYKMSGIFSVDIKAAFDKKSLENKKFDKLKASGSFNVSNFHYLSKEFKDPLKIENSTLVFNSNQITLKEFQGNMGNSDFNARGSISNLFDFFFNKSPLKGNFTLNSNNISLNDFMTQSGENTDGDTSKNKIESKPNVVGERIEIPSFLDCTLNANAKTVIYDNIQLNDVSGVLYIKDKKAVIENLTSSVFGGKIKVKGNLSTKEERSSFGMDILLEKCGIADAFLSLKLFQVLTPIADALEGNLDSAIKISGNLNDDLTPDYKTIGGNLLAELFSIKVEKQKVPFLSSLDKQIPSMNLDKFNVKDIKASLKFENGMVKVKPFDVKIKDFVVKVDGGHSFEHEMGYNLVLELPVECLSKNKLLSSLGDLNGKGLTVPVKANISGFYTKPKVNVDMTSGIKELSKNLIKKKVIDKGKEKVKNLIEGLFGGDKKKKSDDK